MSESDWHPKGFQAYADSNYDYDDAALLAQLWNIPVGEAKQVIGHKIINDIEGLLPAKVAPDPKVNTHKFDWDSKASNAFFNKSHYTFEDAERMAQLWGQADAYAGKKLIGATIISGNSKMVDQLLKGPSNVGADNSEEKWLDAFFNSNYTYDDADLLSQLWNISLGEAKKTIGTKVIAGIDQLLPMDVRRPRG